MLFCLVLYLPLLYMCLKKTTLTFIYSPRSRLQPQKEQLKMNAYGFTRGIAEKFLLDRFSDSCPIAFVYKVSASLDGAVNNSSLPTCCFQNRMKGMGQILVARITDTTFTTLMQLHSVIEQCCSVRAEVQCRNSRDSGHGRQEAWFLSGWVCTLSGLSRAQQNCQAWGDTCACMSHFWARFLFSMLGSQYS